MIKYIFIVFILFLNSAFGNSNININEKNLKQCKNFFLDNGDIKIINILNGSKIELKDIYLDGAMEYKTFHYKINDCFYNEKYLIYSDFIPDTRSYYVLNLRNGKTTEIDGMTHISPNRKYFATEYCNNQLADGMNGISIYSLQNYKITKIFTQEYPSACCVKNIKWINSQDISFSVRCDGQYNFDTNKSADFTIDELKLTLKAGKWEITKDGESSKIKK